ncbi:MAG: zinc-ribbon domain-containing protein [Magnetococcales bacterium]|nr:zinc-ribbon domain-containing protein [Magnetococcales bacterium]
MNEQTTDSVATCPHCKAKYAVDYDRIPDHGRSLKCQKCLQRFTVMKPNSFYRKHYSPEVAAYIIQRKQTLLVSNIAYDLERISVLERYIMDRRKEKPQLERGLAAATVEDMNAFFDWARVNNSDDQVEGFKVTLIELFGVLIQAGKITRNPLVSSDEGAAVDEGPLTEEEIAYVQHKIVQEGDSGLRFDLKRIEAFKTYLERIGRTFRNASKEDIKKFLALTESSLTASQAKGFGVTLDEFYDVLTHEGIIPTQPMTEADKVAWDGLAMFENILENSDPETLEHEAETALEARQARQKVMSSRGFWMLLVQMMRVRRSRLQLIGVVTAISLLVVVVVVSLVKLVDLGDPTKRQIDELAASKTAQEATLKEQRTALAKAAAESALLKRQLAELESRLAEQGDSAAEMTALQDRLKQLEGAVGSGVDGRDVQELRSTMAVLERRVADKEMAVKEAARIRQRVKELEKAVLSTPKGRQAVQQALKADTVRREQLRARERQLAMAQQRKDELLVLKAARLKDKRCVQGNCWEGKGTYVFEDGSRYQGEWMLGEQHGQGTHIYANGNKFVGSWKNGRKGRGAKHLVFADIIKRQQEERRALEKRAQERAQKKQDQARIADTIAEAQSSGKVGCIMGDCENGQGVFMFNGGDVYQGDFTEGARHGNGTYRFKSGDVYKGGWNNNTKHGVGMVRFANGTVMRGRWVDDKVVERM